MTKNFNLIDWFSNADIFAEFFAWGCVDVAYLPTGLWLIILMISGLSLANTLRPRIDYRPIQRFERNKPIVDLAFTAYYDTNHTFLFDRNDTQGLFLGLFQNGSWTGNRKICCHVNGRVYEGYIVSVSPPDHYYDGNNTHRVISYPITTANWAAAHRLVCVQSNGQRVYAYVANGCYSVLRIYGTRQ